MLTPLQKQAAKAIVNAFETGTLQGDYGNVTFLPTDPGGLTYGRSQTTLNSGNLALLITAYVKAPGALYADELRPYLGRFDAQDQSLNRDSTLRRILQDAGSDPVMQTTQDEFFDRVYWEPTVTSANYIGIKTALGMAVVYDGRIHGSWHLIRDRTIQNHGKLSAIGEQKWVAQYVATRRNWLANHSIELLRRTVYRMDTFNQLIAEGNWDLKLPFFVRGLRADAAALSPRASGSADIAPERLIKLQTPYLRGEDIRQVQIALNRAGFSIEPDGVFGPGTAELVKQWQTQKGLTPDGIIGAATRSALGVDGEDLDATTATTPPIDPTALKLTNPPLKGNEVRALQAALREQGIRVSTDGVFGSDTEQAVKEYQRSKGMAADGVVGPATRRSLGL
ncbi:peptidoglycan-binding protein [Spirulina sp. CCNP1310]|uniref:peptidoglycan-binding protein n=1 Tax=Spirulina sp. CCNP1310 TaxID=3110249 RepID=UPI002B216009|nr:peptidoglycan-binding protein [Spirulina sp. CCNP1310]MEA5417775.1 peptidoglycan-binding protein [Spirulina sp. CCNP1310]